MAAAVSLAVVLSAEVVALSLHDNKIAVAQMGKINCLMYLRFGFENYAGAQIS